ncbi:hypothetical protein V8F06_005536 [Rhypophila decipiens]
MTDRPGRSGAEAGFPTNAHTGDDPEYKHKHHRPQDGFLDSRFDHAPGRESLSFTRPTWWRTCSPLGGRQPRLRNDLHIAIGLLELANVGDVAANVWNTVPIPRGVQVGMWFGGIIALSMLFFVCLDARRSWENFWGLWSERKQLKEQKSSLFCPGPPWNSCECLLQVNFKELLSEADRFVMVLLLGSAALMVGIGTCMAPFGESATGPIFTSSNHLTGFVGNGPCALYGVVNVAGAIFVCLRAFGHRRTGLEELENDTIKSLLGRRTNKILWFCGWNAIAAAGAGAAAMCTSRYPFAYIGLVAASGASFYFNWFWRHELAYGRPFYKKAVEFEKRHLLRAISHTHSLLEQVSRGEVPFGLTMAYIARYDVFEEFCLDVLQNRRLRGQMLGPGPYPVTVQIQRERFVAMVQDTEAGNEFRQKIERAATQSLLEFLTYRERWLLEMLGCHITIHSFPRTSPALCTGGAVVDVESCLSEMSEICSSKMSSDFMTARPTPEASPNPARSTETTE